MTNKNPNGKKIVAILYLIAGIFMGAMAIIVYRIDGFSTLVAVFGIGCLLDIVNVIMRIKK